MPAGRYSVKIGKFAGVLDKPEIYSGDYATECEFYTDVLLKNGVPASAVICEDRSMHTRDNAFFSRGALRLARYQSEKRDNLLHVISCAQVPDAL